MINAQVIGQGAAEKPPIKEASNEPGEEGEDEPEEPEEQPPAFPIECLPEIPRRMVEAISQLTARPSRCPGEMILGAGSLSIGKGLQVPDRDMSPHQTFTRSFAK